MDKFVNATRLIGVLDSALARPRVRGNAKSIGGIWCDMAMQYTKSILEKEMSAGGEFRRVVHAHWICIDGSHKCSKCGSNCIEKDDEWIDIQFGCDPVLFCPRCGAVMDEPTENYGYFPVPEDYE